MFVDSGVQSTKNNETKSDSLRYNLLLFLRQSDSLVVRGCQFLSFSLFVELHYMTVTDIHIITTLRQLFKTVPRVVLTSVSTMKNQNE